MWDRSDRVLPTIAVTAAGIAIGAYLYSRQKAKDDGFKKIPTPPGQLPYVGHLLSLGDMPPYRITEWQQELGPMIQLNMGVQTWIMISDPIIAHEIFVTRGSITSGRTTGNFGYDIYGLGGRGVVFADYSRKWKNARTTVLSILGPSMVDEYNHLLLNDADRLVMSFLKATEQKGSVSPGELFHLASMNAILKLVLAKHVESTEDILFKQIYNLVDEGMKYAGAFGYIGGFLPALSWIDVLTQKGRQMRHFVKEKRDKIYKALIKDAIEGDIPCLAKQFYALKEQQELDDDDILVTISDLVAAGTDTIAVTLTWAIAILVHHPEVQQNICQELDGFIKAHSRLPKFTERDALPYFIAVQKECMRYRPSVPFSVPHRATEDFEYRGYLIRKDAILISTMHGMHLNPDIYPQPEMFIPERFLSNTKTMMASANGTIYQRDHYNFGWGRRICPGIYLAETECFSVLVRIFAQCTIAPHISTDGPVYPDLNGAKDGGAVFLPPSYRVRFIKRNKDGQLSA
ncbi:cytochrome P450 [Radiomyces spectabilis]|uniref:cytochrome P450 n=1 Tax=Radiomyces spectabilis TaxID=64574 RepID=UPI0022203BA5|nr:cytochrome P450 [Radiomyces spectabilis]KAI8391167.1 cytochrome P450 [Radiomyces spectabilis]